MSDTNKAKIGIIGGSGVYDAAMLSDTDEIDVDTPFGSPSAPLIKGWLEDREVIFLARHGVGHHISPTELNARANIYAMRKLGVTHVISASAVGSLREEIAPLHMVIPDQIFDRTRGRKSTFFEGGIVAHVSFAEPFCPDLSALIANIMKDRGHTVHVGGTYVCMEGPQFSTKAESNAYRQLGFDIIGMTALPEAKLAREAELCFSMIATVTDYDVWRDEEEGVDIGTVIQRVQQNAETVKDVIRHLIPQIPDERSCGCGSALQNAIITDPEMIPEGTYYRLEMLIGKYVVVDVSCGRLE